MYNYYQAPSYHRRVNTASLLWNQQRYRILQSSLSTLIALRDEQENEEIQQIYQRSINQIKKEITALTARS